MEEYKKVIKSDIYIFKKYCVLMTCYTVNECTH